MFHGVNFQRSKTLVKKNFRGLQKIRENHERFLTVKLLSFTVIGLTEIQALEASI